MDESFDAVISYAGGEFLRRRPQSQSSSPVGYGTLASGSVVRHLPGLQRWSRPSRGSAVTERTRQSASDATRASIGSAGDLRDRVRQFHRGPNENSGVGTGFGTGRPRRCQTRSPATRQAIAGLHIQSVGLDGAAPAARHTIGRLTTHGPPRPGAYVMVPVCSSCSGAPASTSCGVALASPCCVPAPLAPSKRPVPPVTLN